MCKKLESIITFIFGISVGIITGILIAPTKGVNVRSGLTYNIKSYKRKLQELIQKLAKKKIEKGNQAKNTGEEMTNEIVASAKKLLEEAEILAFELEQQKF